MASISTVRANHRTLKTAGLVFSLLIAGLTTANAEDQQTVWVDRENYLANPSVQATCEAQVNAQNNPTPTDTWNTIKNFFATQTLLIPAQIDNCMQQKGFTRVVVSVNRMPPMRPNGYYYPPQPVYPQPPVPVRPQPPVYSQPQNPVHHPHPQPPVYYQHHEHHHEREEYKHKSKHKHKHEGKHKNKHH